MKEENSIFVPIYVPSGHLIAPRLEAHGDEDGGQEGHEDEKAVDEDLAEGGEEGRVDALAEVRDDADGQDGRDHERDHGHEDGEVAVGLERRETCMSITIMSYTSTVAHLLKSKFSVCMTSVARVHYSHYLSFN